MRILLEVPSSLPSGVTVTSFARELFPDNPREWIRRELGVDEIIGEEQTTTTGGWPLLVFDARIGPEYCTVALLACFEHLGVAVARSTAPLGTEIRGVLRTVQPIASDAPACLAELVADPPVPTIERPVQTPAIAQPIAPASPAQIAAWEASRDDVDAQFNAGLANYGAERFEAAYASWNRARELAPDDFDVAHKLVQVLFALGRDIEAAAALDQVRALWRDHADPAIRARDEVVIDQRVVAGRAVQVTSTLRPRDPQAYAITTFRTVDGAHPITIVRIETSDYARLRGEPFVLSIETDGHYRVIGAKAELPAYRELVETASSLITSSASRE